MKLGNIAKGRIKQEVFLKEIRNYTCDIVEEIKTGQGTFRHDNLTNKICPNCGKKLLAVNGKNAKMLVCQDRECGYKETLSRTTNARCPKCHKRMEMYVKGKEETFICACGYKEKLSAFQARRANEAALRAMGLEAIAAPRSGNGSGSGFGGFGNTGFDPRPKATLKPRVTAKADKPYISKGINGLNQLAGLQKGTEFKAPDALDYTVGDRVRHIKYGEGTVLNIAREPRDYKVTVDFDQAGQKIMYASFAKLKQV